LYRIAALESLEFSESFELPPKFQLSSFSFFSSGWLFFSLSKLLAALFANFGPRVVGYLLAMR